MIRKTIFGALSVALALTATVTFARTNETGSSTRELRTASSTNILKKIETRIENHNDASSSKPILRARGNASSTAIVDSTCAKAAVDVRKISLVSAYSIFTTALNSDLSTREDAVKASFDQTTKKAREDARQTARSNYKKSVKTAYTTLRSSEKSALKTYSASIKKCGGTADEANNESSDGTLSDSVVQ